MKKGASIGSTPFESLSYLVYQLSLHGLKMHWRKFICRILKKKKVYLQVFIVRLLLRNLFMKNSYATANIYDK